MSTFQKWIGSFKKLDVNPERDIEIINLMRDEHPVKREKGFSLFTREYYRLVHNIREVENDMDEHEAVDIYVNALLSVFRYVREMDAERIPSTRLIALLKNKIKLLRFDRYRKLYARASNVSLETLEEKGHQLTDDTNPFQYFEQQEVFDFIIARLNPREIEFFTAVYSGLKNEEIQEKLGYKSRNTVAVTKNTLLKKIRKIYEAY